MMDKVAMRVTSEYKEKVYAEKQPVSEKLAVASSVPAAKRQRVTARGTPPFCLCMRRAKLKIVKTPSPNLGRAFFTCTASKCAYFAWCEED